MSIETENHSDQCCDGSLFHDSTENDASDKDTTDKQRNSTSEGQLAITAESNINREDIDITTYGNGTEGNGYLNEPSISISNEDCPTNPDVQIINDSSIPKRPASEVNIQLSEQLSTTSNMTLGSGTIRDENLLDDTESRFSTPPNETASSPESSQTSITSHSGKVFNKTMRRGPVTIKTCTPNGEYIILKNTSTDTDIDVSNWLLIRCVGDVLQMSYTIPSDLIIQHESELKIYARCAENAHHQPPLKIINDKFDSWGMGSESETRLYDDQGEEKAVYLQRIVF